MAVPSANTLPRGSAAAAGANLRKPKKVRYDLVILMWFLVVGTMVYSIIKPTMHAIQQQDLAEQPLQKIPSVPIETVESDMLEHEDDFLRTIKSCIPGDRDYKNCGIYVPSEKQRIAIIAPPGEMSNMLWHWVEQVVKKHENALSKVPMEFIRTSHVPPYGYGKTHGLTKVIRLVPKPLVMGVADAMQQIIVDGENHHHMLPGEPLLHQEDITLEDLKAVTRQFLRFHCRLSKLAAHTAILSINLESFLDNFDFASQSLYDFIRYSDKKQENDEDEEDVKQQMDGGMEEVGLLSSELSFVSKILTRIQASNHDDGIKVLKVLDDVLRDEMRKTKDFTTWPCDSFWTVGEQSNNTQLSHFAIKVARNFSPNCTDPLANCWVPRDLCEAKGDGPCKDRKKKKQS